MANANRLDGVPARDIRQVLLIAAKKAPPGEREDLLQEVSVALLKAQPPNGQTAWGVARNTLAYYWRRWRTRQHYGIDSESDAGLDSQTVADNAVVWAVEWEPYSDGRMDADRIWALVPDSMRRVLNKRLLGGVLTGAERVALHRWRAREGYKILLASKQTA